MRHEPEFADDLSALRTHAFSYRSLTWWGIIAFMVIEGAFFALAMAAYFFLMAQEQEWAPRPWSPPDLLAGTLFTAVMLLSEVPNTMIKRAANAYDVAAVRKLLPVMSAIGLLLVIIRGFEFNSLNVFWYDNAYGSIIWALLFLHTTHIVTDWGDTLVLWQLMKTPHGEDPRRLVDTDENALYWRFVWLTWLPIYVLIYWVPRLFR
ncbi:cytochrome c oxidase subunit 3 [Sphingomonas daechungensis]|uniref:Cytochrome c oxidase subunit 3 n=1 Tax=Sphingomonas daechungensis TaxID=1176646 RepID=A0ABX6T2K7_9SPHN|nr:cytochrome c oxidase subunit 3 [Sphingomonas daechungensis]QNP43910.1 cytochrome c oxidase subunit 3 [Sphingomonas daechungensis]